MLLLLALCTMCLMSPARIFIFFIWVLFLLLYFIIRVQPIIFLRRKKQIFGVRMTVKLAKSYTRLTNTQTLTQHNELNFIWLCLHQFRVFICRDYLQVKVKALRLFFFSHSLSRVDEKNAFIFNEWKKKRIKRNSNTIFVDCLPCAIFFFSFFSYLNFVFVCIAATRCFPLMHLFPLYLYKYLTENVQSKSHFIPMCTITIDIERNVIMYPDVYNNNSNTNSNTNWLNKFVEPFM